MISLEVEGVEVMLKGITQLPEAYRDLIFGKYCGKPII